MIEGISTRANEIIDFSLSYAVFPSCSWLSLTNHCCSFAHTDHLRLSAYSCLLWCVCFPRIRLAKTTERTPPPFWLRNSYLKVDFHSFPWRSSVEFPWVWAQFRYRSASHNGVTSTLRIRNILTGDLNKGRWRLNRKNTMTHTPKILSTSIRRERSFSLECNFACNLPILVIPTKTI